MIPGSSTWHSCDTTFNTACRTPPARNWLLAQLPAADSKRLFSQLEPVELEFGSVVYEANQLMTHAYFPVNCLLSTLYETADGDSAEVALTGSDGLVGVSILLGDGTSPTRTIVQHAGLAYRLSLSPLRAEFNRCAALRQLILRYLHVFLVQTSQSGACNRHHTVEQRLCRWLLVSLDHLPGQRVNMTQQLIASTLGVRREGVTIAVGRLRKLGLISCHRGGISIIDRDGVEQLACECYEVIKRERERLLYHSPYVPRVG